MTRVLELEASKGWGGQEQRTVRLAKNMPKDAVETLFVANPDSQLFRRQSALGITVLPMRLTQSWDLIAVWKLVCLIRERQIELVVTHSGKDAWLGGMASRVAGVKCIRVRHLQTPFRSAFSYKYLSDAVITVSEQVRQYVISRGVPEGRVHTIYTGVDTERFCPGESTLRSELGIAPSVPLIGIVAVLRAAKRHKDLIEAFSRLPQSLGAHLVIAGDGPQRENLEALVNSLGLRERVHLLGHREDTPNILRALDLFVLSSDMEALGTALLEAQACGVPVVASRVGGIPECVVEGETGLLFEPENVAGLGAALERMLGESRAAWAEKARAHVLGRFSAGCMAEQTVALYERIV